LSAFAGKIPVISLPVKAPPALFHKFELWVGDEPFRGDIRLLQRRIYGIHNALIGWTNGKCNAKKGKTATGDRPQNFKIISVGRLEAYG
jgi:hypothetical protein